MSIPPITLPRRFQERSGGQGTVTNKTILVSITQEVDLDLPMGSPINSKIHILKAEFDLLYTITGINPKTSLSLKMEDDNKTSLQTLIKPDRNCVGGVGLVTYMYNLVLHVRIYTNSSSID